LSGAYFFQNLMESKRCAGMRQAPGGKIGGAVGQLGQLSNASIIAKSRRVYKPNRQARWLARKVRPVAMAKRLFFEFQSKIEKISEK
jgi:hypothetical protein